MAKGQQEQATGPAAAAKAPEGQGEKPKKAKRDPATLTRHEVMHRLDSLLKHHPPSSVVRWLTLLVEEYREKIPTQPSPAAQPGGTS